MTDERTLRLLELPAVLQRVENQCASPLGRERVHNLVPTSNPAVARRGLDETTQARRFLELPRSPIFGGVTDMRRAIQLASIGGLLDPADVLAVARLALAARKLRDLVASVSDEFPLLREHIERIEPQPQLETAIFDAIDDASGEIKDDASLDLLRARRNIRRAQADVQERLRRMIADPNIVPLLQDAFVTLRDGRYCLPVKSEARGRVPGIVHDRSGSGGAVFIEPQPVVELNNRLRELAADEREAIRAILTDLSGRIGGLGEALTAMSEAVADLDFAFAKARLSQEMRARDVTLNIQRTGWALKAARHPLIQDPIPNDIYLGELAREGDYEPFDVLLITGPNTGGKTVVMKTLGLLTLMAMCGLHLPVEENSQLALPGRLFADIGDEQSIAQSLSTFSSHVRNIVQTLSEAKSGDLVLLDEIGAGTDPDEGAALGKAVLRTLQRRGVLCLSTTHYGELKAFALSAQRFENASVEFDAKTLRPTYHLRIGVPGASNALDIASRLGMPPEIVGRARRYLGQEHQESEAAAQRLEETQRELTEAREAAMREANEAARLRGELETRLQKLRDQIETERAGARREAREVVSKAEEQAAGILRELRRAGREGRATEEARGKLKTMRDRVTLQTAERGRKGEGEKGRRGAEAKESRDTQSTSVSPSPPLPLSPSSPLRQGDTVRIKSLDREGVLLTTPDDSGRASVRIGAMRLQLRVEDLEPVRYGRDASSGGAAIRVRKSVTVPEEINIIGKTVEEAVLDLEKYLDDALLADTKSVRIVHGRGTGALRAGVHRLLKSTRGVRSFGLAPLNEGGEGATVVRFEEGAKAARDDDEDE